MAQHEQRKDRVGRAIKHFHIDLANETLAKTEDVTIDTVRARMRKAVSESQFTLAEVADRMGIAQSNLSRTLSSKKTIDLRLSTIISFAAAIGRPPSEFLQ